MSKSLTVAINKEITQFKKIITVDGDKSISHRALLLASQCLGLSRIKGLLNSEDVMNTVNTLKKLGVKIKKKGNLFLVSGNGLGSFRIKNNAVINAGNAGTLTRLIMGLLATYPKKIKIIGDKSLSKRPMGRVIKPLAKIGCSFYPKNQNKLPLTIVGTDMPLAQKHEEKLGSAQVKSAILLSALNTPGTTEVIEEKISRDHTENILKFIGAKINIKKFKKKKIIRITGGQNLNSFNFKVSGDLSSAAFFVVLTLLSKKSILKIKNVNCNFTRLGFIEILKKMNGNIKILNKHKSSGEMICDLIVKSSNLNAIRCSGDIVPRAIDEFPILLVAAAKAKGVSTFHQLSELNKKESPRLKIMSKILKKAGVKLKVDNSNIQILGSKELSFKKQLIIETKLDHRIGMSAFVLGQVCKGKIKINSFETVKTSFPNFLKIMRSLGAKYETF